MQRPAILRLVEAQDLVKVAEIVETEFVMEDEAGITDFEKIEDDMAEHEVAVLGPVVSQYILKQCASQFGISAQRFEIVS